MFKLLPLVGRHFFSISWFLTISLKENKSLVHCKRTNYTVQLLQLIKQMVFLDRATMVSLLQRPTPIAAATLHILFWVYRAVFDFCCYVVLFYSLEVPAFVGRLFDIGCNSYMPGYWHLCDGTLNNKINNYFWAHQNLGEVLKQFYPILLSKSSFTKVCNEILKSHTSSSISRLNNLHIFNI